MKRDKYSTIGLILRFLKGSRRYFVLTVLTAALMTATEMLPPRIVEFTVDSVLGDKAVKLPSWLAALLERAGGVAVFRANLWYAAVLIAAVERAAKVADLHDSITNFAAGYDTFVGERGVTLSGGQKQRAAIARMVVRPTPVMILDDSLSAVDTETDANIRKALKKEIGGSTTILISHRITTLMQADHIIVLDKGRIVEQGSHGELLAADGIYRRIYDLQSRKEGERA